MEPPPSPPALRRRLRRALAAGGFLLLAALGAGPAAACSKRLPSGGYGETLRTLRQTGTGAFDGVIAAVTRRRQRGRTGVDPWQHPYEYVATFAVRRVWKGRPGRRIRVLLSPGSCDLVYDFRRGRRFFVVYAPGPDGLAQADYDHILPARKIGPATLRARRDYRAGRRR